MTTGDRLRPPSMMKENEIDIELEMRQVSVPVDATLTPQERLTQKRASLWAARVCVGEHVRKHKGDHGQTHKVLPLGRADRKKGQINQVYLPLPEGMRRVIERDNMRRVRMGH